MRAATQPELFGSAIPKQAFRFRARRKRERKPGDLTECQILALLLSEAGFTGFVPEYHFALSIGRKFRFDLCQPRLMLGIEVEGAIWQKGGGGHSHPTGILRDAEKQNIAVLMGYSVLRFTTDEARKGPPVKFIESLYMARKWEKRS